MIMDKQKQEELRDQLVGLIQDFVYTEDLEPEDAQEVVEDAFVDWMGERVLDVHREPEKRYHYIDDICDGLSGRIWAESCLVLERRAEGGKA